MKTPRYKQWQRERLADGLCIRCGRNPLATKTMCEPCRQAANARHFNKTGRTRGLIWAAVKEFAASHREFTWRDLVGIGNPPITHSQASSACIKLVKFGFLIRTHPGGCCIPAKYKLNRHFHALKEAA
jgi:hypothetical protein